MSTGKKKNRLLLVGTITYAIGSFGTKFLNFLIVPLYTYFIEPSDLGEYDLLVTTVSLLSPLITMRISDAAYRWIINNQENEVPYISASYLLLLRNAIIYTLIIVGINHFIPIWNCYYFIAILIGDRILECLQKLLRGLKNQKLFAVSGIMHTAIMVGLNFIKVCVLGENVEALLQSSVISIYITIAFLLICEKRLRNVDFTLNHKQRQREMLHYSIPLIPTALSWWIMSTSDRYVIRWLIGSAANGIYSVVYKYPTVLTMLFTMFNYSWSDMALSEFKSEEQSEKYVKELFQKLYTLAFEVVFVLIPVTKLFMEIVLSNSYKSAAIYVGFLYLGTLFHGFSAFFDIGYYQGKQTKGAAKTSIFGAGVNFLVNVLLIRHIGLHAAAISTFLGYFTMWLLKIYDMKTIFYIKIDKKRFGTLLSVAILLAIVSIWTSVIIDTFFVVVSSGIFIIANKKYIKRIMEVLFTKIRNKKWPECK